MYTDEQANEKEVVSKSSRRLLVWCVGLVGVLVHCCWKYVYTNIGPTHRKYMLKGRAHFPPTSNQASWHTRENLKCHVYVSFPCFRPATA